VHEEQNHKRGLDGGDEESDNRIERSEVDEGRADRGRRQDKQSEANKQIKRLRVGRVFFVLRHKEVLGFRLPQFQIRRHE